EENLQIVYAGSRLRSFQRCFWKVRVWDGGGFVSEWSAPSHWEMGVLDPSDWAASWVGAPDTIQSSPLFRRSFALAGGLKSARAFICGLGCYELYLNGQRVGDNVFDPAQTDYEKRALYSTYDITPHLLAGEENALGVMLGNGWYNQDRVWGGMSYGKPTLICMLRVEYSDGTVETIGSDSHWRVTGGPLLRDNVYAGELYDARLEIDGWASPALNDSAWDKAEATQNHPPKLQSQMMPPMKRMKTINPVSIVSPEARVYVYDLGQNFSGWVRLRTDASEGAAVTLRYAETVDSSGNLLPGSTGVQHTGVVQTDTYICKGYGNEVYEPRFTYHGFRYVEVTRFAGEATLDDLEGVVVHSAVAKAGAFECSDPMLNRIHRTAVWTLISNLHGIPTDCPHRERCGWLGDSHVMAEMSIYNFEMARFWEKYLDDIETSLTEAGLPTMVAPGKRKIHQATPDWGTAIVQIPWFLYLYYGDKRVLESHYETMERWVEHLQDTSKDYIVSEGLGDWCAPKALEGHTPVYLISTAYFYYDVRLLSRIAGALGRHVDAEKYREQARLIKDAFITEFYDRDRCTFGGQTANAFALYLNLIPVGDQDKVAASLADDVRANGAHHTTGITGSKYLFWALSTFGHGGLAQQILNQTDYPSIGHLFAEGATTLWECWGEEDIDREHGVRSQNHPMQGGFDAWFFNGLAGISPDLDTPGFKNIILRPQVVGYLNYAQAIYQSVRGAIESEWEISNGIFYWSVVIPANTTASIYLPTLGDMSRVVEGKTAIRDSQDIEIAEDHLGHTYLKIGSGEYQFRLSMPD
ncbi:MAG: glycoside hydrolase family 78 protein, partial [Armatimonadota bacterium]